MVRLSTWFRKGTSLTYIILGFLVGIGGALGAASFHELIAFSTLGFYGQTGTVSFLSLIEQLPTWQRLLIPTFGGLLVGIIFSVAKVSEAEGEGVPEVQEALAHKRGIIRPIVAPVKIITAAITLGSGGSAGREGPVIQIGSAIGSTIAQRLKLETADRNLLLAAGAAAAIGGAFGAPIAGVLFTIEILRHSSHGLIRASTIVIAAFTGAWLTTFLTGYKGLRFLFETQFDNTIINFLALLLLAVFAVALASLFRYTLIYGRRFFRVSPLPSYLKPAIGGFGVGLIGLFLPTIHEPAAYPLMLDLITFSSMSLALLGLLLVAKMVATSLTLGSGGSGGIFAPLLLLGALLGSLLAGLLMAAGIIEAGFTGTMTIVGMAVVFSAAAHAPLTAAFITYEMTENLSLLPALLITCIIASLIAKQLHKDSIYHHDT